MGYLVNATGWFPDDILDRLTWADVADLQSYWQKRPPLQPMIEGYFRSKGMLKERKEMSSERLRALAEPQKKR